MKQKTHTKSVAAFLVALLLAFSLADVADADPPAKPASEINKESQVIDLSGRWSWEGRPHRVHNKSKNGRMQIDIVQDGRNLSGELYQYSNPGAGVLPYRADDEALNGDSTIVGEVFGPAQANNNQLVIIKRRLKDNRFLAIFTGNISADGNTIEGNFTNTWQKDGRGWFVMRRHSHANQDEAAKPPRTTQPENDRQAILDVIDRFEKAVTQKDIEAVKAVYLNASTPVSNRKGNGSVRTMTADAFARELAGYKEPIAETFHEIVINVHGNIASLTAIYKWSTNHKFQARGKVIWLLAKTKDGWKVNHHSWHKI